MNRTGLPSKVGKAPRVLIVGTFPSERSLADRQYYADGRNRFWSVLAPLVGVLPTDPYRAKVAALKKARIALWDVLASCERDGSSADRKIVRGSEVPNDLPGFLRKHPTVRVVIFNGRRAGRYCRKLIGGLPEGVRVVAAPSTSSALPVPKGSRNTSNPVRRARNAGS